MSGVMLLKSVDNWTLRNVSTRVSVLFLNDIVGLQVGLMKIEIHVSMKVINCAFSPDIDEALRPLVREGSRIFLRL